MAKSSFQEADEVIDDVGVEDFGFREKNELVGEVGKFMIILFIEGEADIGESWFTEVVSPEEAAHGITDKRADVASEFSAMHGNIVVIH